MSGGNVVRWLPVERTPEADNPIHVIVQPSTCMNPATAASPLARHVAVSAAAPAGSATTQAAAHASTAARNAWSVDRSFVRKAPSIGAPQPRRAGCSASVPLLV